MLTEPPAARRPGARRDRGPARGGSRSRGRRARSWAPGLDGSGWDRPAGADQRRSCRRWLRSARPGCAAAGPAGPPLLTHGRASPGWPGRSIRRRPCLHHDHSDVHRRAAAHAAGIILQHCADTGQAYWAWTGWDWARLAGSSSREFLDGQALPTETAVRPFLVALAYLLGGFSDFQHLGMFNRLHLAQLVFGAERRRRGAGRGDRGAGPLGLPQPGPRRRVQAARRARPGAADQPQSPPGRPDHRGVRPAARPSRCRRPPAPGDALRAAESGRLPRVLRCRPSGLAATTCPVIEGTEPGVGRLGRAVACHLAADAQGPRDHPHHHRQGRTVAGGRAPRDHRARAVDPGDLRGLGRSRRPDGGRRLRPAPRPPARPRRETGRPAHQGPHAHGHPHVLPRLPGMGVVPPPVRPRPGRWPCRAASAR